MTTTSCAGIASASVTKSPMLDVRRARCASLEEVDLDRADTAADFEDGRAVDVSRELGERLRRPAQAASPEPARVAVGRLPAEDLLVVARAAASCHARDCTTG
jgi:hypothetical protein